MVVLVRNKTREQDGPMMRATSQPRVGSSCSRRYCAVFCGGGRTGEDHMREYESVRRRRA